MSRTKTFDVFLTDGGLTYLKEGVSAMVYPKNGTHKAKLIVELPERIGTITESEFDDAALSASSDELKVLRIKIFGKATA